MTTFEKIKLAIRRRHDKLDSDLLADIEFALADLRAAGVVYADESDPLIFNAVKMYCKSANADDVAKSAEYLKRYESLKSCLMMMEGYSWKDDGDE